jgi:hypothetical protein
MLISPYLNHEAKIDLIHDPTTDINILKELSYDKSVNIRQHLASRTNNKEILDKLSNDVSMPCRILVALNENTSESTLDKLSLDETRHVKLSVIANKNTGLGTLNKLRNDVDKEVALAATSKYNSYLE